MRLGCLIAELIHHQIKEISEHQVDDRPAAGHGRAHGDAHEAGFGDRRVDDAVGAEFLDQTGQNLERRARLGDILADDEKLSDRAASLRRWPR